MKRELDKPYLIGSKLQIAIWKSMYGENVEYFETPYFESRLKTFLRKFINYIGCTPSYNVEMIRNPIPNRDTPDFYPAFIIEKNYRIFGITIYRKSLTNGTMGNRLP